MRGIVCLGLCFSFAACGPRAWVQLRHGPAVAGSEAFWQFRDWQLAPVPGATIPAGTSLGVGRYAIGSAAAQAWADDPDVLLRHEDDLWGMVLLRLDEEAAGDRHAAIAHSGGGCGLFQRVDPLLPLVALPAELLPPIFSTQAKLGELTAPLEQVSSARISSDISTLVSLGTRYHAGAQPSAATAAVQTLLNAAGQGLPGFRVETIVHERSQQQSVRAILPGLSDDETTVIIGAHLDSIARATPTDAPGADDDASGVATIIEVLRVIKANKLSFARRLEIHAYAAEEVGLIGSAEIARQYRASGRKIAAMLQLDMTAYSATPSELKIHLVDHDTTLELRRALRQLLRRYTQASYAEGSLPQGASSDHKSWSDAGFNAVFPFEDPKQYNPLIHSAKDTVDNANAIPLAAEFAKLSLAFVAHYAGLDGASGGYQAQRNDLLPAAPQVGLPLAIGADENSLFKLAVRVPEATAMVELCRLRDGSADDCLGERLRADLVEGASAGPRFFSKRGLTLEAGQRWRLYAYDAKDSLLSYRQFELAAIAP